MDKVLTTNLTIVVKDLNGKVFLYNSEGVLVQEEYLGGFIKTKTGLNIQISDFITSTGLQIKSDPGIVIVYFSRKILGKL